MCSQQDYSNINIHMLLLKQNLEFSSRRVHYESLLIVPYRRIATNLHHGVGKQKFKVCPCTVRIFEYKILNEKTLSLF